MRTMRGHNEPGLIHRDVIGKMLITLIIMALAFSTVAFSNREAASSPVASAAIAMVVEEADDDAMTVPAFPVEGEVQVKGLDFAPPRGSQAGAEPAAGKKKLVSLRESGDLRAYSVPAGRLAFTPDGGYLVLPASRKLAGPIGVNVVMSGSREVPRVALTFDTPEVSEGDAGYTRALIDELLRLRTPATFFVCGRWVELNPEIAKYMVQSGFEVGSHSYSHREYTRLSAAEIADDLARTEKAFKTVTGHDIAAYCRPPYGSRNATVDGALAGAGYIQALWDIDTNDWRPGITREMVRDTATLKAKNGSVVLMHTNGPNTRAALVEIVNNLRADGYELTTLSGVLQ